MPKLNPLKKVQNYNYITTGTLLYHQFNFLFSHYADRIWKRGNIYLKNRDSCYSSCFWKHSITLQKATKRLQKGHKMADPHRDALTLNIKENKRSARKKAKLKLKGSKLSEVTEIAFERLKFSSLTAGGETIVVVTASLRCNVWLVSPCRQFRLNGRKEWNVVVASILLDSEFKVLISSRLLMVREKVFTFRVDFLLVIFLFYLKKVICYFVELR